MSEWGRGSAACLLVRDCRGSGGICHLCLGAEGWPAVHAPGRRCQVQGKAVPPKAATEEVTSCNSHAQRASLPSAVRRAPPWVYVSAGSAIALALLSGGRLPLWAGVLLTAVCSFTLLFIERFGIRLLEAFFGLLVGR